MIRHGDETSGGHYTLYLEYLGGLVPLLKGKRASKIRPDFVIFDPKIRTLGGRSSKWQVILHLVKICYLKLLFLRLLQYFSHYQLCYQTMGIVSLYFPNSLK